MKKYALLLSSLLFIATGFEAAAAPILLTISDTENQETQAWWPSQPGLDKVWVDAFAAQGLDVIETTTVSAPKLSPVVYGSRILTHKNAKTLGSLFGTTNVLNGNVSWNCTSVPNQNTTCSADTTLTLLYEKNREYPIKLSVNASASTIEYAKKFAIAQIASQVSLAVLAQMATNDEVPAITAKPMLIINSLPDADTLVTLRKRLKRIPGVTDVAERWVANGTLALDINPDNPNLPQTEFLSIIQRFTTEIDEGISVRETGRSAQGVMFEVVKY